MTTCEDRLWPTEYRLPIRGDNALYARLVVAVELHWLQCHLDCFASYANVVLKG